jgi:hypothetical protein
MRWIEHVARMGRRRVHIGYCWKSQKKIDHYKDQDLSGGNIKIYLREIEWGYMYWIDLAQDRDQWRALVSMIMKFRVP